MPKTEYNEQEWVEFREPVAPISMADLQMASGLMAAFGSQALRLRQWCCDSIEAWQMCDAYGAVIEGKPTPDALMRLDMPRLKWLFGGAVAATLELPLPSSSPSKSESIPAAAA